LAMALATSMATPTLSSTRPLLHHLTRRRTLQRSLRCFVLGSPPQHWLVLETPFSKPHSPCLSLASLPARSTLGPSGSGPLFRASAGSWGDGPPWMLGRLNWEGRDRTRVFSLINN
jgi:hypothetical protein